MCLLTYFPEGSMPDTKDLENGAIYNDDGHGFAIVDTKKNRLIVRKSMDGDLLIELFEEMRAKHLDGPALFHSRIGTGGYVDKGNCHPFYIGGTNRQTVIAHNGILPAKAQPKFSDKRSDTRLLAEEYLPVGRFGAYHTRAGRKALGKWAGNGNKFAILSVDPSLGGHGFLVNAHAGEWVDGPTGPIWYSNTSYDASCWNYRYSTGRTYSWSGGSVIGTVGKGTGNSLTNSLVSPNDSVSGSGDDDFLKYLSDSEREEFYSEWEKTENGAWIYREGSRASVRVCLVCKAQDSWVVNHPSICSGCYSCSDCGEYAGDCSCYRADAKEREYVQWWLSQGSD